MCYTSGTTGNPKGVAYSHRSSYLHSLAATTPNALGLSERDRVLMIVPMFHANAWGIPYAAFMCGASLVMPGRFLQAEPLTRMIKEERVTFSGAVPTIWADILRYGEEHEIDLSTLRMIICGGSAVPRSLMESFEERYGVRIVQGWGMTETSPLAAVAHPPASVEIGTRRGDGLAGDDRPRRRRASSCASSTTWATRCRGTAKRSARSRCAARGSPASTTATRRPRSSTTAGCAPATSARSTRKGYIQITDRAKDVIKSGGEWISSVELENHLMAHPDVIEASVIGVPDPRWEERPLACVVRKAGLRASTPPTLAEFLGEHVAKWQVPERWASSTRCRRRQVGKFDKKVLRARHEKGELRR